MVAAVDSESGLYTWLNANLLLVPDWQKGLPHPASLIVYCPSLTESPVSGVLLTRFCKYVYTRGYTFMIWVCYQTQSQVCFVHFNKCSLVHI